MDNFVKNALRNPALSHVDEERLVASCVVGSVPVETPQSPEIVRQIFAPDPETGIPACDLALMMSENVRPEISKFISETLAKSAPSPLGMPTADEALEMSRNFEESREAYAARLKVLCSPKPKTEKK